MFLVVVWVSEGAYGGDVFIGPFRSEQRAQAYADRVQTGDAAPRARVEPLESTLTPVTDARKWAL